MDQVIDDILNKLKAKYGISKFEAEKIIDSEFKVLMDTIQAKKAKTVSVIHIGKWKPTKWFKENHEAISKGLKRHSRRVEESSDRQPPSEGVSGEESTSMCGMSPKQE